MADLPPINFTIGRDFLDGILLQQPTHTTNAQVRANVQLRFLPSDKDGVMHTAIAVLQLGIDGQEQAFGQGGWRILFTTSRRFDPQKEQHPFLLEMLKMGSAKLMAVLNSLSLHAAMPLIPFNPDGLQLSPPGQQAAGGAAGGGIAPMQA